MENQTGIGQKRSPRSATPPGDDLAGGCETMILSGGGGAESVVDAGSGGVEGVEENEDKNEEEMVANDEEHGG
ncbi:hypothetical protein AcV7_009941 [Taiwanofungus camphoratus]|nr:hypothetical protein AcV7_009941 [Antrodia cinnamomea]